MSTIEQTLNAGVPVIFPGGEQFHLLEADDPVDVTFYDNRNSPIEIWESMKGGFRHTIEKGFIQVRLESATGQTVKIALTSGRGQYDRSQGDISVTNIVKDNSWYYDTLQKNAFMAGKTYGAVAGQYNHIQLHNPAASGIMALCHKISFEKLTTTGWVEGRVHNTALTAAYTFGRNKYLDEADAACSIRTETFASLTGGSRLFYANYNRAGLTHHELSKPIILAEGKGFNIICNAVNEAFTASFEWIEVPA